MSLEICAPEVLVGLKHAREAILEKMCSLKYTQKIPFYNIDWLRRSPFEPDIMFAWHIGRALDTTVLVTVIC
jgi:hypothetical protein